MNRTDHRLLGAAWGVGFGSVLHLAGAAPLPVALPVALGCGAVAAATAGGRLSPDVDQWWRERTVRRRTWSGRVVKRKVRPALWLRALRGAWLLFAERAARVRWWCDEGQYRLLVREEDPTQHRGITHWWGAAAVATVVLAVLQFVWLVVAWAAALPGVPTWPAWAALVGWWSHLGGDLVHGMQVWGQDGHGLPTWPWWGHRGVGWRSAGLGAHLVAWGLAVPAGLTLVALTSRL